MKPSYKNNDKINIKINTKISNYLYESSIGLKLSLEYSINYFSAFFVFLIMFVGIILNISVLANQYKIFGKNTLNLVLGFISWYIFRGIISGIKNQIRKEQLDGVLEQKFLSVYSPLTLTIINQLFSIIIFILNGFIIFILIKLLFKFNLNMKFDFNFIFNFIIYLILFIILSISIGIVFFSLTLLFKELGNLMGIYNFLFLSILATSSKNILLNLFPGYPQVMFLKFYLSNNSKYIEFLIYALLNTIFYLILSILFYRFSIIYCKKKGTLTLY